MRTFALIALCLVIFGVWAIAQNSPSAEPPSKPADQSKADTSAQSSTDSAKKSKQAEAKKEGTLSVQAQFLGFFSRGEGTLTVKGHGFLLVSDYRGDLSINGFTEQKSLPRGVQIPPQWRERIKIYHGTGTLTLKGKYDAIRGHLKNASIQFRGNGAFNVSGIGKVIRDGKEMQLYATAAMTVLVPEAVWQPEEPDVAPSPRMKR